MPPPRSFYRTRRFWLGLPVLLFLLWAWWDSTRFLTLIEHQSPHGEFELSSFMGVARASHFKGESPGRPRKWLGDHMPVSQVGFDRAKHPPLPLYLKFSSGSVSAAHWFLISLYVAVWIGTSLLWNRRKTRLMNAPVTPS